MTKTVAWACSTALSASERWRWSSDCGCCASAKSSRRIARFVAIFRHEIQLIKWLPVPPALVWKSPELPAAYEPDREAQRRSSTSNLAMTAITLPSNALECP